MFLNTEDTYSIPVRAPPWLFESVYAGSRAAKQLSIVSEKVNDALVAPQWVCNKGPQGKS